MLHGFEAVLAGSAGSRTGKAEPIELFRGPRPEYAVAVAWLFSGCASSKFSSLVGQKPNLSIPTERPIPPLFRTNSRGSRVRGFGPVRQNSPFACNQPFPLYLFVFLTFSGCWRRITSGSYNQIVGVPATPQGRMAVRPRRQRPVELYVDQAVPSDGTAGRPGKTGWISPALPAISSFCPSPALPFLPIFSENRGEGRVRSEE